MTGKIIKIISNLYSVQVNNEVIECHARGKFRQEKITPLVGDICEIDIKNKYILKILPRKNYLLRPMIANVDVALIVTSVKIPDLSLNLLDKMLSIITINKIEPVICFTKLDLLTENELNNINKIMDYYKRVGYQVFTNENTCDLLDYLNNKIVVVTGQTGAGKSTLLNKIDKNLNLKTGEVSISLGRGKHTTRHVELFNIKGCLLADTPGFSSLEFNNCNKDDIKRSFIEFNNYPCKFRDCIHNKEIDCGVKEALNKKLILESRYNNYINFINKM